MPSDLLNQVAALPSPAGAPGSAPASGAAAQGPPKVPGARNDIQARIDELSAREKYYKQRSEMFERELSEVRERTARLEGRAEGQPEPAKKTGRTWQDMSDEQLDDAIRYGLSDEGRTTAGSAVNEAFNEKLRRTTDRSVKLASTQTQKQIQHQQLLRDVHARILRDFGPDAFDETTPLYGAADSEMAAFIRDHGKDRIASDPEKLYDAFLRAERKVRTSSERERLKVLEQENQDLHQRASLLERGGVIGAAPKPNDEVQERLKAGDTKGAIRKLLLTQNLIGSVRNRVVIPGR